MEKLDEIKMLRFLRKRGWFYDPEDNSVTDHLTIYTYRIEAAYHIEKKRIRPKK